MLLCIGCRQIITAEKELIFFYYLGVGVSERVKDKENDK